MKKLTAHILIAVVLFAHSGVSAQQSVSERLGYAKDDKLLIIHADDLGVSHSTNAASIASLEKGSVNSASIMVPCPWFPEIATYARKYGKKHDFGIHLTLNSEWGYYKWGPVSPLSEVPSLVDRNGYFHTSLDSLLANGKPREVELELRNQVKKALDMGIDVTHLDAHMYAARRTEAFMKAYINVGRHFMLPMLLTQEEKILENITLRENDVVVDRLYQAFDEDYDMGLEKYYTQLLDHLEPGLNCLLIHTAFNTDESKAMTVGHTYWGARWRQEDFDFFTSEKCRDLLEKNNIKLVTWREIRDKITRQ